MSIDHNMAALFQAIDIATGYLLRRGCSPTEANALVGRYVPRLFEQGEHRPLIVANRALAQIERELRERSKDPIER
ncbi:hypothetical protein ACVILH_002682 [Bradyrhizobium sp. USDA 4353]